MTEDALRIRIEQHLEAVYPDDNIEKLAHALLQIMDLPRPEVNPQPQRNLWDQSDVFAISYGNSIQRPGEPPLQTLQRFLQERLYPAINGIHLLPFFPYSSDDGFAVTDYGAVDPQLGEWADISDLARDFKLMADLVINHCSSEHPWFQNYLQDRAPGRGYFLEVDPSTDLSAVVRPRTSPLLRPSDTVHGQSHVWCTFSHDQVDLNFRNPQVLLEFAHILRQYLEAGVRVFRLDAVAFLWKIPGSDCVNLPQTHEIVRLLRCLLEHHSADAIVITETNIPNQENLSYFGNANEAHLIYNFSLPPLLVNSLITGDCRHLKTWMMSMPPAQHGTSFLNFIASHDGIGLRPTEGLLDKEELAQLIRCMEDFGGHISWRSLNAVERLPYEINIALIDALKGTVDGEDGYQIPRFLCAHTIMLALEGIPAFYLHSLLGTENDYDKVQRETHFRAINRHIWDEDDLRARLQDQDSLSSRALRGLLPLIQLRQQQAAFHPNAIQFTLHLGPAIFAFWRQSLDKRQSIFALNNISAAPQSIALSDINLLSTDSWTDLISGDTIPDRLGELHLQPYQCVWLSNVT